ncbi:MAG: LysR family transcriptional regulator [Spirochaetes bacterium]|nr:MAG: LysR family transcriptional regulator [Spirochaetota bacterium]
MADKSTKGKGTPQVRLHLWIEDEKGVFFGPGRFELLRLIDSLGSLKLAAEKMGISYRAAWGKIKKTEEVVGKELLHKENNKEGYKLTESGILFMKEFKKFYDDVADYASKRAVTMVERLKRPV